MMACDHDLVVRVERVPPPRQPGPYVRWFCQDPACSTEFNPALGPGRLLTWLHVQKLRGQLYQDALIAGAIIAAGIVLVVRILF